MRLVAACQIRLAQLFFDSLTVPDKSEVPKLKPFSVMDNPPVEGPLYIFARVKTGASKENLMAFVPTIVATVSAAIRFVVSLPAGVEQST
jgi:hypothetical protein